MITKRPKKFFHKRKLMVGLAFSTILSTQALTLEEMQGQSLLSIDQAKPAPLLNHKLPKLNTESKTKLSLSDFSGKVILLDFWASWCGPCRASFPWMNGLTTKYEGQDFQIVAINLDQENQAVTKFLNQVPAQFTLLQDKVGVMPEAFEVMGMPSSYLIDRKGRLRSLHLGFHENKIDEYESVINRLLNEKEN